MLPKALPLLMIAILFACTPAAQEENAPETTPISEALAVSETTKTTDDDDFNRSIPNPTTIATSGTTLATRFIPPPGFQRIPSDESSYASYLRALPLKPHNSLVAFYNGRFKSNPQVYDAVVDQKIGNKDLHQCADAIMRLRAEYLWKAERYEEIHFDLTNGFRVDYTPWMQGQRIAVRGNTTSWYQKQAASNSYTDFWSYMELIFTYAGTSSLSKELKSVPMEEMQIGDVFIHGGSPGHAVLVIDMVQNEKTGAKLFLLAQSYMPAQQTQILKNPRDAKISPWYRVKPEAYLETPEWGFEPGQLMRFE